MRVNVRIDCSPNEFRRFCGEPDVSPLFQIVASALERWLKHRIARLDTEAKGCGGTVPRGGRRA